MKKRSFTLLMSALTISATLIGTSPVAAKTDTDTATEETTDKEETTAKDADSENTDNKETDASKSDTLEDGTYTAEFDTRKEIKRTNPMASSEPANAATTIPRELTDSEISRRLSMVMTERIHTELLSGRDVVATGRYPYTELRQLEM